MKDQGANSRSAFFIPQSLEMKSSLNLIYKQTHNEQLFLIHFEAKLFGAWTISMEGILNYGINK